MAIKSFDKLSPIQKADTIKAWIREHGNAYRTEYINDRHGRDYGWEWWIWTKAAEELRKQ